MYVIQSHINFVHQLFDGSEGDVRSGLIDLSQDVVGLVKKLDIRSDSAL